jgi:arsenate reductase (thioredoxin)
MPQKTCILFLCVGNACRSQMAEGWARHLRPDTIAAASAGALPKGLDPRAVSVMAEAGVDISKHRSKTVTEFVGREFDYVITLCGEAEVACPVFPGRATVLHRAFDDPPALARNACCEESALAHYRRVRDEIRDYVATLPVALLTVNEENR